MAQLQHFVTVCLILVSSGWTISPCKADKDVFLEFGKNYTWSNIIPSGYNVSTVDFVIYDDSLVVVNCTTGNLICHSPSSIISASVELNGDQITANLTISSVRKDLYACIIVDLNETRRSCQQTTVYLLPKGLSCTLNYTGSSPVIVTCKVEEVYPANIQCTLYRRVNSQTVKLIGPVSGTGALGSLYYSSNCSITTSDIVSPGTNWFYMNVRNPWVPGTQGLNSSELSFDQNVTVILAEARKQYTFTNVIEYSNSVSTLDWVIVNSNTMMVAANCSATTLSCSPSTSYPLTLVRVGNQLRSNFTFPVTTDLTSVCMLANRQNTVRYCQNFTVYAFPESVSCSVTSGSTYVTISCQAEKVFPGQIVCAFFRTLQASGQNSTDAFLGKTSGTGTLQSGYYKSSCSLSTVEVSWGLNQYFVNVRNPLAPSGEGLNSTTVNLYANTVTLTGFNIGSPTGFLQCQTSPAPAQVIRITRRGLGTEVATSYNTSLLTYNMANASCLDLDEYVCEANEVKAYFHLVVTCSPRLVDNVNNETYSRKIGSTVLIPPIVVSSTAPPSVFILLYNEEGVTYQARSEMFKAYYVARSLYFGTVNLAIYDLTEGDYRSYAFYIRSGSAEGAAVYFALSQESSDVTDYKPAVIALGILFAIFAQVVVVFTVVYLCRRCRRRGPRQERSQPAPVTFSNTALVAGGEFYDSMSTPESDNDHYGQVSGLPSSRQAQDTTYVNAEVLPDLKQNRWKTSDPETYGNAEQIKKHYSSLKQK